MFPGLSCLMYAVKLVVGMDLHFSDTGRVTPCWLGHHPLQTVSYQADLRKGLLCHPEVTQASWFVRSVCHCVTSVTDSQDWTAMAKGVSHFRLVLTSGQPGGGGRKRPWGLGLQRKTPFQGMAPVTCLQQRLLPQSTFSC